MFDKILKPKFYTKCKSRIKCLKIRLEVITRRRNAVQKHMKSDIVELLWNNHGVIAYGRAEGLLVEQNLTCCYQLVEKFIGCISNNLEAISEQRKYPDECKEAIQSLIYAAARFADLPELRDVRTLFTNKFGNSLEPCISEEFVEKLRQDQPTKEMKVQLLHDIAQEFSIQWDSKSLEQKNCSHSPLNEERPKHDTVNEELHKNNQMNGRDKNGTDKGNQRKFGSQGRDYITEDPWRHQSGSEGETITDSSSQDDPKNCSSSVDSVSEDDNKKPLSDKLAKPPYLKPKSIVTEKCNLDKVTDFKTRLAEKESNDEIHEPVIQEKPKPRSVRRRPLKPPSAYDIVPNSKTDDKLDGLLMNYGEKESPHDKSGKEKHRSLQPDVAEENRRPRQAKSSSVPLVRGPSLPLGPSTLNEAAPNRPTRAASFEPGLLSASGNVTSKRPPDYENLAARIASLNAR